MRRHALPIIVLLTLALALLGAATAPRPHHLPAVALSSVLIWRVEIAAVAFIAAYIAMVAVRLSLHGLTFTHLGSRGIENPDVLSRAAAEQEAEGGVVKVTETLAEFQAAIEEFDLRLKALEDPRDVLLRSDQRGLA
ncbi:MAG TPA: hypothetical protein VKB25_03405 [Conexibacter sp.]|nr:hypothetical protein [Conexibacter sp.]